jgi:hypothetical protein
MTAAARAVESALLLEDPRSSRVAAAAAAVAALTAGLPGRDPARSAERRAALEESLLRSYGTLSDRLIVSTLLAGAPLSESAASHLFDVAVARRSRLGDSAPPANSPGAWLEELAIAAASGRCPPVGRGDLAGLRVETPEGDFHWSDHIAINRALMAAGSSIRLMTLASLDAVIDDAARVVGGDPVPRPVDTGFILGDVGPVTATPLAPLRDYCREYATSPALPEGEAGFVFDDIIVLRRGRMRLASNDLAALDRGEWPDAWQSVFTHECVHVRSFTQARRHSFLSAGWLPHVVSDVLRLCDVDGGADRPTIARALAPNFENVLVWSDDVTLEDWQVFLDVDMRAFLRRWPLDRITGMMVDSGLLTEADGRLHRTAEHP